MTTPDWAKDIPAAEIVNAPLPLRFAARAIDLGIVLIALVVIAMFDLGTPEGVLDGEFLSVRRFDSRIEYLLWGLFSFSWSTLWIATCQATPGKRLLGLRFQDPLAVGGGVTLATAVNRSINKLTPVIGGFAVTLGEDMVLFTSLLVGAASFTLIVADENNRTVMDRIANTTLIKR